MRVLVVEDNADLADTLVTGLAADGFATSHAQDGNAALRAAAEADFEVILLDRDLPGLSGDAVCRALRAAGIGSGIIMVTASGSLSDRVEGLDLGADDYLPKPFAYVELVARIRALGRRSTAARGPLLQRGDVALDSVKRMAERRGERLFLTPKEFAVLETLLAADGGFVSTSELLDEVWDGHDECGSAVVKVTIHGLRRKLGDPPAIHTAVGHGYRLD